MGFFTLVLSVVVVLVVFSIAWIICQHHISSAGQQQCSRVVFTLTSSSRLSIRSHACVYSLRERERYRWWLTRVAIYREQNNKGVMVYVAMLSLHTFFLFVCLHNIHTIGVWLF